MTAVKIVAALLGFIAGVLVYPFFDRYVVEVLAFVGAVAVGIVTYLIATNLLGEAVGRS